MVVRARYCPSLPLSVCLKSRRNNSRYRNTLAPYDRRNFLVSTFLTDAKFPPSECPLKTDTLLLRAKIWRIVRKFHISEIAQVNCYNSQIASRILASPKCVTLSDLERRSGLWPLFCDISSKSGHLVSSYVTTVEVRPTVSATKNPCYRNLVCSNMTYGQWRSHGGRETRPPYSPILPVDQFWDSSKSGEKVGET